MAPHNSTFQRRTIRRHCLIPILKKKLGDLISCVTVRFFYLVLDEYNLHENKKPRNPVPDSVGFIAIYAVGS